MNEKSGLLLIAGFLLGFVVFDIVMLFTYILV